MIQTNGSPPVIVDLADQESRYGHIEEVFDRLTAYYGVAGYRIAPKIVQVRLSEFPALTVSRYPSLRIPVSSRYMIKVK